MVNELGRGIQRWQQQQILLKIINNTNYITFSPQIAYKLIEAGRSEDLKRYRDIGTKAVLSDVKTAFTLPPPYDTDFTRAKQ